MLFAVTLQHYCTALSTALQLAPPATAAESSELITTATNVVDQLSTAGKVSTLYLTTLRSSTSCAHLR
jgi:hypothetical protein